MNKRIAWFVAGLMVCAGSVVSADNEWGVFGSYWTPSDGEGTVGGGGKIGIEMVDRVQLDIRLSTYNDVLDEGNLDVTPLEFGLAFSVPVNELIAPYLEAGVGYYYMDGDGDVDNEWGVYFAAGLEYVVSRSGAEYGETMVKLFLEGLYRSVTANDAVPTSVPDEYNDADLDGLAVQAGMLIAW